MVREGSKYPVCHTTADPLGDHHASCGGNSDRILRHDCLREVLYLAAKAALAPRREVPSRGPVGDWPHWNQGQPAALDVTVISTMQQLTLTVRGAADTQGHALMVGEERKPMQRLVTQYVFPSCRWWLRPWGGWSEKELSIRSGVLGASWDRTEHFTGQLYFPFVPRTLCVFMERDR